MTTSSMPPIEPSVMESKQVVVLGGTLCVPLTFMIKVNTLLKLATTFCQGLLFLAIVNTTLECTYGAQT